MDQIVKYAHKNGQPNSNMTTLTITNFLKKKKLEISGKILDEAGTQTAKAKA